MRLKLLVAAPVLALLLAGSQVLTRSGGSPALMTVAAAPAPAVAPSGGGSADNLSEVATGRRVAAFYVELARQEQERADAAAAEAAAKAQQRQQAARPSTSSTAPAPQAESAPAPVDGGDAEAAVRAWFPDLFSQAWGVSGCESGHNPGAVSRGGGNWGLFQINTVHKNSFTSVTGQPWSEVLNANYNAQFARWLYDSSGWGPWACKWAAR